MRKIADIIGTITAIITFSLSVSLTYYCGVLIYRYIIAHDIFKGFHGLNPTAVLIFIVINVLTTILVIYTHKDLND